MDNFEKLSALPLRYLSIHLSIVNFQLSIQPCC